MKTKFILPLAAAALCGSGALAGQVTVSQTSVDNVTINDNDLNGLAEVFNFTGTGIQSITDISVGLNISSGFNGDYYAYLEHDGQISVLLNRVGLVDGITNPYGYSDAGFNVTLTDGAASGDIHTYQNVFNPNGGAITGTFQPDGRPSNPLLVTESDNRTALLNVFNGAAADGAWVFFIADVSPGGIGELNNVSLQITGNTPVLGVPDTGSTLVLLSLVGFPLLVLARKTCKNAI